MPNKILNLPARTPRDDVRPDAPRPCSAAPVAQQAADAGLWQTHRLRWCRSLVAAAPAPRQSGD